MNLHMPRKLLMFKENENEDHSFVAIFVFRGPSSSSLDQSSPPLSNMSPPYPHHLLGKYDDDFPLRKTGKISLFIEIFSLVYFILSNSLFSYTHL